MSAFQAAVAHPKNVGVDALTGIAASSRARNAPVVPLFPMERPACTSRPERARSPPPSMTHRDASSPPFPSPPPHRTAEHPTSARRRRSPSPTLETTLPAGTGDRGSGPGSCGRRSAALHAARMVQSLMEEEAERDRIMATSKQVEAVQGTVDDVLIRLQSFSESQAVANARLDAAFVQVTNRQTAVFGAAATMTASEGQSKRPSGPATAERATKRGKTGVPVLPPSVDGAVSGEAAAEDSVSNAAYYVALVHDWTLPAEMLTATLVSQPLFEQLTELVKMCHVLVGEQGLFGTYACLQVYEEGLVRNTEVVHSGRKAAAINAEKTEQMRNVVKNKVKLYVKQQNWLYGLVPTAIEAPDEATFERLRSFALSASERAVLTVALNKGADVVGWPPNHPIRTPARARINTLRTLLSSMARHVPNVVTNADVILRTPPFDKLLAMATKNVRKKYN